MKPVPEGMHRYRIRYRDPDPCCPVFSGIWHAYDRDHALERFYEDGDDWVIVSCERIR